MPRAKDAVAFPAGLLVAALSMVVVSLSGCAGQSAEMEQRLAKLELKLAQLQAVSDRSEERVAALENAARIDSERARVAPASVPENPTDLPVVHLGPGTENAQPKPIDLPNEEGANDSRPLIVGEGERVETRSVSDASVPVTKTSPNRSAPAKPARRANQSAH